MAVTQVNEIPQHSGDFPAEGDVTLTRVFQVIMDGPGYYPNEVIIAVRDYAGLSGVDKNLYYRSEHPTYPAMVNRIVPEQQTDSRNHWKLTYHYTTAPPVDFPWNLGDRQYRDPLLEPQVASWSTRQKEFAPIWDVDGNPILNPASRPFDPPPTVWRPVCVLTISRPEAGATFASLGPYIGKTNATEFMGAAERTVLCANISAQQKRATYKLENGFPLVTLDYWQVTYEFEFIEETAALDFVVHPHDLTLLNADYEEFDPAGFLAGNPRATIPILDSFGVPVRTPWPLDENGDAIPRADLPDAATYSKFQVRFTAEFNDLNFTPVV